jgi:hypothetical protein
MSGTEYALTITSCPTGFLDLPPTSYGPAYRIQRELLSKRKHMYEEVNKLPSTPREL